jgi:hypothetical protein
VLRAYPGENRGRTLVKQPQLCHTVPAMSERSFIILRYEVKVPSYLPLRASQHGS